jgi:hypothetical protein
MMTTSRVRPSLAVFLALVIALGAVMVDATTAIAAALFILALVCLDPKPAWKWFYDPPGDVDSGRASGRFFTWRRVAETLPRSRLPRDLP